MSISSGSFRVAHDTSSIILPSKFTRNVQNSSTNTYLVKSTNCKPRSTQGMLKTTHSGDQSQVDFDIEFPGSNFCIVSNAQNDDGHFFIRNRYCGTGLLNSL